MNNTLQAIDGCATAFIASAAAACITYVVGHVLWSALRPIKERIKKWLR